MNNLTFKRSKYFKTSYENNRNISNIKKMKKAAIILIIISVIVPITGTYAQKTITLEDAINTALENNPAIKINKTFEKEADAKLVQARSTFLPRLDFLGKYFYANNLPGFYPLLGSDVPVMNNGAPTDDYITLHPMAPYPNKNRDVFTNDLNLIYPIYIGGKRINAEKSLSVLKEAYQKDTKETEASIVYKVNLAFYNNIFIKQVIDVYDDVLIQLEKHHELAKKAYKEGVRSEFDIVTFESKIQDFKTKIVEMKGNKAIAETALKNLMNIPSDEKIECSGNLELNDSLQEINFAEIEKRVDEGNYKMQSLLLKEQVLNHKKDIIEAGKMPTVFTFGNFHVYHGMDFPPFDKTWRSGYAVGVGVKMNIFDGNLTKGKSMEIQAGIDKIKEYQNGLSLQLRFEVSKALETLRSLEAQKISTISNIKVSQKAFQIAQIGYENGVNTSIELNDAQLNVLKVKIQLLKIEKDILIAKAKLDYLKGSNLE